MELFNNKFIKLISLLCMFCSISCSEKEDNEIIEPDKPTDNIQPFNEYLVANFETEDSSPYFFRFGNSDDDHYFPRWQYLYEVISNPYINERNTSEHVFSYTSMEARSYGVKFLFENPVNIEGLRTINFIIYQPDNVIDKPSWNNGSSAFRQQIAVKILSSYNTVNDFKQDDGILLEKEISDFTEKGEWINVHVDFDIENYSEWDIKTFKNGVVGIAIMPTYGSATTLLENSPYVCYIDNIVLNKGL